jgi:hypothetical protein
VFYTIVRTLYNLLEIVRLVVFRAVTMEIAGICNVASTLKEEAARSSEISVNVYQSTRHCITQDSFSVIILQRFQYRHYIATDGRMNGKGLEGRSRVLVEVISLHFPRGTEEDNGNSLSA